MEGEGSDEYTKSKIKREQNTAAMDRPQNQVWILPPDGRAIWLIHSPSVYRRPLGKRVGIERA